MYLHHWLRARHFLPVIEKATEESLLEKDPCCRIVLEACMSALDCMQYFLIAVMLISLAKLRTFKSSMGMSSNFFPLCFGILHHCRWAKAVAWLAFSDLGKFWLERLKPSQSITYQRLAGGRILCVVVLGDPDLHRSAHFLMERYLDIMLLLLF